MTFLAIQYVFSTYRDTESLYHNILRYGIARRYPYLCIDYMSNDQLLLYVNIAVGNSGFSSFN